MPFEPDARLWGQLLSACNMHQGQVWQNFCSKGLRNMQPANAGTYIYAAVGAFSWDGVVEMGVSTRDGGLTQTSGYIWIKRKKWAYS